MDPITGIIAAAGIGMQIAGIGGGMFGGLSAAKLEKQAAQVSAGILQDQMQQNELRRNAMNIMADRSKLQAVRQGQLAQAQALTAATNQGAAGGGGAGTSSGLAGGMASVASQTAFNVLGTSQQQLIGNQLFNLQDSISFKQQQIANLEGKKADAEGMEAIFKGIGQIGSALTGSAGPMGNILGQFFGNAGGADAKANSLGFGYNTQDNYMNDQGFAIGGV